MVDRPILFSAPMVRALLDGRKTQTRRVLSPENMRLWTGGLDHAGSYANLGKNDFAQMMDSARNFRVIEGHHLQWQAISQFTGDYGPAQGIVTYAPGDRLWVREAFSYAEHQAEKAWYWADGNIAAFDCGKPKPSIHMPRWASRLTLTVADVRVERLQDCSEADAIAEGIEPVLCEPLAGWRSYEVIHTGPHKGKAHPHSLVPNAEAVTSYRELWDSINGPGAWDANPWIVAVTFTVGRHNIDAEAPHG